MHLKAAWSWAVLAAVAVMALSRCAESAQPRKVVCYFSSWSRYRPSFGKLTPSMVDGSLCTHLIYSFAGIDPFTWKINPTDAWADLNLNGYVETTNLKKSHPSLKVLLGVGGYNLGSAIFSDLAMDEGKIDKFVASAIELLRAYNFDGLDLDWEFPTSNGGRPSDKPNFTKLIRVLQTAFAAEAARTGLQRLTLSAAVSATAHGGQGYEQAQVCSLLDFVSLMTYDFNGAWTGHTGPNAGLYAETGAPDPTLNTKHSVDYWLSAGCAREKLIVGTALYGRTWTVDRTLYDRTGPWNVPARAGVSGPYTKSVGIHAYYELCHYPSQFDPVSKAQYGVTSSTAFNYDSVESMKAKGQYIIQERLGGIMVWELALDDITGTLCGGSGKPFPLLRAASDSVNPPPSSG